MDWLHVGSLELQAPDDRFLGGMQNPRAVLRDMQNTIEEHGNPGAESERTLALIQALDQLAGRRHGINFQGQVMRVAEGAVRVHLEVYCRPDATTRWRQSPAAAQLFRHMLPLTEQESGGAHRCSYLDCLCVAAGPKAAEFSGPGSFSLRSCYLALPSKSAEQAPPPLRPGVPAPACGISLALLPSDTIARIVAFLDAPSLRVMAATCRHLRALAADLNPDLALTLHPHQRAAVRWMLQREGPPGRIPHPTLQRFPIAAGGGALWGNTATGALTAEAPPELLDFRGGLFADEPGLGKTITSLALVLRTRGTLPAAPAGAEVTWFARPESDAPRFSFYSISQREATSVSKMQRAESMGRASTGAGRVTRASAAAQAAKASLNGGEAPASGRSSGQVGIEVLDASEEAAVEERGAEVRAGKRPRLSENLSGGSGSPEAAITPEIRHPRKANGGAGWTPADLGGASGSGNMQLSLEEEAPGLPVKRRVLFAGEPWKPMEAAFGFEGDAEDSSRWLQCEICQRWRRLPSGYAVPGGPWCCHLHPTAALRNCAGPEDVPEANEDVTCLPGWVGLEEEQCCPDNVQYFRKLLAKHQYDTHPLYALTSRGATMDWLSRQPPDLLRGEFGIHKDAAVPPGYGRVLLELGLEAADPGKRTSSGRAGNCRPYNWHSGMPEAKHDWLRWEAPLSHYLLRLDTVALRDALRKGPAEKRHRIFLSSATLVVVPTELVQHWRDQISWHTRAGSLRVAVYDTKSSGNTTPGASAPQHLAWNYDVVLTTFSVMSAEWDALNPVSCSPLAQVHWLRVILDEGHTIGTLAVTSKLQMAAALRAERRWVMTGTPAPSVAGVEVTYLHPLLTFLHDQALGLPGQRAFQMAVERPMAELADEGRWRLMAALSQCMIRASKAELTSLPKLKRRVELLEFSPSHAVSYNFFVDIVRSNLLTSDWYDPDHKECLLAEDNARHAAATLNNLALSCNVAGNCLLQVSDKDLQECLELIAGRQPPEAGCEPPLPLDQGPPFMPEGHPLSHMEAALRFGGSCQRCGAAVRAIFATPCTCLLCMECAASDRTRCARCAEPYEMQSKDDPARLRDNPAPKWDVPRELIEWQPAYAQRGAEGASEGRWQPKWWDTDSTKCAFLVRRLREMGALPRPLPQWEAGEPAEAVPALLHPPQQWQWQWEWEWEVQAGGTGRPPASSKVAAPPKVIVFSQFWEHALLLERSLERAAPAGSVAQHRKQMTPAEHWRELSRFRENPACNVLLMDESGALGLDLSFAEHVFLMEPMANAAAEEQVVSRAHRMGASRNVTVEVLVMRGTMEEVLLKRQRRWRGEAPEAEPPGGSAAAGAAAGAVGAEERSAVAAAAAGSPGKGGGAECERRKLLNDGRRAERNAILLSLHPVRTAVVLTAERLDSR